MSTPDFETYDLEAVYDAEISPLMAQIIEICRRHNMPMLATFAYSYDDENGVGMCTSSMPFDGRTPPAMSHAVDMIFNRPSMSAVFAMLAAKGGAQ